MESAITATQHQYISTIVTGQNEDEILNAVRSMSRSGKADGFIVLYSRVDDPVIDFLFNEGLLYILIGKPAQYTNHTIYIDNDNLLAGQEATEYLYAAWSQKDRLPWRLRILWSFPQIEKPVIWQHWQVTD